MKKIFSIALISLCMASCELTEVLDLPPKYQADLDGAITTPAAVELALNGVYQQMPGAPANVIYPTVSGSFKAGLMTRPDDFNLGNAVYYTERNLPLLSYSDGTEWTSDYAVIKNANFLEVAVNRMSDNDFSGNRRTEILGEIAYLRAMAYFRILNHFCEFWNMESEYGVIFRNEAPSVSNSPMARSTVGASYEYILSQLETAIEKAPEFSDISQANRQAAKALRAKVLFYAGRYAEAVTAVNDAIDTDKPLAESSYSNIFDNFGRTKEIYFARVFDDNDASYTMRVSAFSNESDHTGYWGPSKKFQEFAGDDPRTAVIYRTVPELKINRDQETLYDYKTCGKTWNPADNMPIIFSREAELYLIKAESLYRTGASISDCYAPVAQVRSRAGASVETPANREDLEDAIFREWMIEMSFENWHEWFAMIRFAGYDKPDFTRLLSMNRLLKEAIDKEYATSQEKGDAYYQRIIDRRIDAIPSGEISANQLCKQNPGYN